MDAYQSPLTTLPEVSGTLEKINELARANGVDSDVVWQDGNRIGFNDGGQLTSGQAAAHRYMESHLDEETIGEPTELSLVVRNVIRYGLISHGLFDKIKIGPLSFGPNIGIRVVVID